MISAPFPVTQLLNCPVSEVTSVFLYVNEMAGEGGRGGAGRQLPRPAGDSEQGQEGCRMNLGGAVGTQRETVRQGLHPQLRSCSSTDILDNSSVKLFPSEPQHSNPWGPGLQGAGGPGLSDSLDDACASREVH